MPVVKMEEWRQQHCHDHCWHWEDDPACKHWRTAQVRRCCKCGVRADHLFHPGGYDFP